MWRDTILAGDRQQPLERVVDIGGLRLHARRVLLRPAILRLHLTHDVDQSARVDDVVHRVEDAALAQQRGVAVLVGELVVGGPRDDAAAQLGNSNRVDARSEGAGREHVALLHVNLVGRNEAEALLAREPLPRFLHDRRADVGGDHRRAVITQ